MMKAHNRRRRFLDSVMVRRRYTALAAADASLKVVGQAMSRPMEACPCWTLPSGTASRPEAAFPIPIVNLRLPRHHAKPPGTARLHGLASEDHTGSPSIFFVTAHGSGDSRFCRDHRKREGNIVSHRARSRGVILCRSRQRWTNRPPCRSQSLCRRIRSVIWFCSHG